MPPWPAPRVLPETGQGLPLERDFRNSAAVASLGLFLRLRGDFHISRGLTLDRGMFYGLAAWELVPRRGGA
jgi:hypothetical protein